MARTYSQQLNDPQWFRLRKEILGRDGHRCREDPSHRDQLEVHHLHYELGRMPWDYPHENFLTLCSRCHKRRHDLADPKSAPEKVPGAFFTWSQIEDWIGPGFKPYLNDDGQRINCGTFKLQLNPDAPDIILPGKRVKGWELRAIKFAEQSEPIPVFVKAEGLPWEYVGEKKVEAIVRNPREISLHAARSRRLSKDGFADRTGDISLVMFLT